MITTFILTFLIILFNEYKRVVIWVWASSSYPWLKTQVEIMLAIRQHNGSFKSILRRFLNQTNTIVLIGMARSHKVQILTIKNE